MKTPPLEYHAPESLEQALALLAEHGDEAKILAGGQSLIPLLAMRLARPAHLVDVNGIAGLDAIEDAGQHLVLGTTVRERTAERSAVVRDKAPLLAEALPHIGHVAIRNRGTVGGSLAHADASGELPAVAVAVGAELLLRGPGGDRVVGAGDFFEGHFTTVMADDECLIEVRIPAAPSGQGWSFQEVARRHGDFALVGVAATLDLDASGAVADARIVLMGVDSTPLRATAAEACLRGAVPDADTFAAAAAEATRDLEPGSDVHGSAAFRRHLAGVVVRRALARAAERAGAEGGARA